MSGLLAVYPTNLTCFNESVLYPYLLDFANVVLRVIF